MMMNTILMLADASAKCKCPPHAIAALAGTFAVGMLAGYFLGRRARADKAQQQPKRARAAAAPSPRQPIPAGSVEIYVGNLSYELTEPQLRAEFEKFGTVASARIVTDKGGQRSKGFGFVVMPNRPEAERAIAAMSEKEVLGRKMRVNEARNTIKEEV